MNRIEQENKTNRHEREVLNLHLGGMTDNEIAKETKLSKQYVGRLLIRAQTKSAKSNDVRKAISLHRRGMKQIEIANELGVKQGTVSRWLRKHGFFGNIAETELRVIEMQEAERRRMKKQKSNPCGLLTKDWPKCFERRCYHSAAGTCPAFNRAASTNAELALS